MTKQTNEGYIVYRKDRKGDEFHQFCSSFKDALEMSDRKGGGYITISGNFSPTHFRNINKPILDSLIKDEEKTKEINQDTD